MMQKRILLVALAAMLLPAPGAAQTPAQQAKLKTAQQVYDRLARQFRDGRTAPPLVMSGARSRIAVYQPDAGVIQLEEAAYDATTRMGADSLDALSYILAHELAHFYKDHATRMSFDKFFAGLAARDTIATARDARRELLELETEADFSAGFNSYLAGYAPLEVGPRILRDLYGTYKIDTARVGGHPPLADRIEILKRSSAALANMISLFEGGTHLMIAGRYKEAGQVFEHLSRAFPSREILSNAGMARAMEALALMGDSVQFVYPFEMDTESRLTRGDEFGFGDEESRAYVRKLLTEARDFFEMAKLRDPAYAPAYVNLAAVYNLLDETELSLAMAGLAIDVAEQERRPVSVAHARIVRGIALAEAGRRADAEAAFKSAQSGDADVARMNLAVLSGGEATVAAASTGGLRIVRPETIANTGRSDYMVMEDPHFMTRLPRIDRVRGELTVYGKQIGAGARGFLIGDEKSQMLIIATAPDYQGETAHKIKIGSTGASVRAAYGEPARVLSTTRGEYLIYDDAKIAFAVDDKQRVTGWIIYGS